MKTTKALFFELMYDFQSERWNEFELPKLSLRELLALAKLLGCPSCGSKEAVIVRLLAHRELRLKLARFADNPEELANSYQRESLRDMCGEAGIWRSGNKRALSAAPPELAQSVPRARPGVFRRNAIADQSAAATTLSSFRNSFLIEEFPSYPCTLVNHS
jgi:predicted RNA-binding Zn-ribbon protein involved in translation (DUF1610 family)